jgi:hypothetical protein
MAAHDDQVSGTRVGRRVERVRDSAWALVDSCEGYTGGKPRPLWLGAIPFYMDSRQTRTVYAGHAARH